MTCAHATFIELQNYRDIIQEIHVLMILVSLCCKFIGVCDMCSKKIIKIKLVLTKLLQKLNGAVFF